MTALLPQQGRGGPDRPRLAHAVETVIAEAIDTTFLQRQKPTAAAVIRDVQLRCRKRGIPPPSGSTVRRRLKTIRRADRAARGETVAAARPLHGATPIPNDPLDVVQIDHTKVDLIVVDPQDREPIGRPWITLAIDVYSRCIAGFYLNLDPPSATSVGLCLTHIATVPETVEQTAGLAEHKITLPVLALGGEYSLGEHVRAMVEQVAVHVDGGAVPGCGHFVPEEQPEALMHRLSRWLSA